MRQAFQPKIFGEMQKQAGVVPLPWHWWPNRSSENAHIPVPSCCEDYPGCALTPSDIEDEEYPGLEPEFSPGLHL